MIILILRADTVRFLSGPRATMPPVSKEMNAAKCITVAPVIKSSKTPYNLTMKNYMEIDSDLALRSMLLSGNPTHHSWPIKVIAQFLRKIFFLFFYFFIALWSFSNFSILCCSVKNSVCPPLLRHPPAFIVPRNKVLQIYYQSNVPDSAVTSVNCKGAPDI